MTPPPRTSIRERFAVAWHERAVVLKAISFGLVGLVNSAIDFAVFSFAYYYLDLPIIVANAMAWIVAVTASYVMTTTITFAAESGRSRGFGSDIGVARTQMAGLQANTAAVW